MILHALLSPQFAGGGARGKDLYPEAQELVITADGGGSNGSRVRLWKIELQKLANELNTLYMLAIFLRERAS